MNLVIGNTSQLYPYFKEYDKDIVYYSPKKFLPTVGFQILENMETEKCKKIGDPNGFCAVWCICTKKLRNIYALRILK